MVDENEDDLPGMVEEAEEEVVDMVPLDEDDEDEPGVRVSEVEEEPEFFENLAEVIPDADLKRIADSFIEKIERDKLARQKRDEQYEEGLRRTGLGNDAPGGASFPGASKAVHPIMIEAGVDFCSRVMREVYPPNGPVKDKIVGDQTQEKLLKAKRKVRHMNWQLTVQCPEFRSELEQTLTQTPMGGNCYMKVWWDEDLKRPSFLMVPVDKIILPFAAASYRSASRRTHVIDMIHEEVIEKQDAGVYRKVDIVTAIDFPEETRAEKANDKIEGRERTDQNQDGIRSIYEITVPRYNLSCDAFEDTYCDGKAAPYVITIDKESREVLAIYRNWDPEDRLRMELEHFVEWTFLPWRGALALGLPHVIGTLSGAATGALRALLDSAHIQNAPTALKLADPTTGGGQTVSVKPTQVSEIGGGAALDDIRKVAMPMPFNPPSSTLFQLLTFLVQEARGVIRTSYQEIADSGATPVGTTYARMEQAMVVFSSICARAHQSMANLFTILHRLNKQNLDDYVTLSETGEILAYRDDYDGPVDVVPVSDPNIFSEAQRQNQAITIVQRATGNPMYDAREVEKTFLRAMKVEDPDRFLIKQPEPERLNPVNENVAAAFGRPLAAFPDQDHLAHIQVHLDFMASPFLGSMPNVAMPVMQGMVEHLKQHVVFWYVSTVYDTIKNALGVDPKAVMVDDSETQAMFDRLLAVASRQVIDMASQQLEKVPPVIQQAMQMLQQMQPPMPMDPTAVSAMDVQRRQVADQMKDQNEKKRLELNEAKLAMDAEERQRREAMDAAKIAADAQNKDEQAQQRDRHVAAQIEADMSKTADQLDLQFQVADMNNASRERMNREDNATAMAIAEAEIESAEKVQVSTGTGINPGSQ